MTAARTIGILGGMGPQAGIDLVQKITSETRAKRDQDHLPIILISKPDIPDRTAWLAHNEAADKGAGDNESDKDKTADNATGIIETADPAPAIAEGIIALARAGAGVAAVACNTAHTPAIFDRVQQQLLHAGAGIRILHLIEETVAGLVAIHPDIQTVGVLGTHGTLSSGLYQDALERRGLRVLSPADTHRMTSAIYDPGTGIKAFSSPVSKEARHDVLAAIRELADRGARAIILGCTELPLAVPEAVVEGTPLIDPARMLARALVRTVDATRLYPAARYITPTADTDRVHSPS